jgi:FkbM family methyltransferase
VVIDIGGNVGTFAIPLAKKFPFLKIYAFEPAKENFKNFKKNIALNGIPDGIIHVENLAVTSDGRPVNLQVCAANSGGSTIVEMATDGTDGDYVDADIPSITLGEIFKKYGIETCKLLKMDCEGAEYEILYNVDKNILKRCTNLRAEFHENKNIRRAGCSAAALDKYCRKIVENIAVVFNGC